MAAVSTFSACCATSGDAIASAAAARHDRARNRNDIMFSSGGWACRRRPCRQLDYGRDQWAAELFNLEAGWTVTRETPIAADRRVGSLAARNSSPATDFRHAFRITRRNHAHAAHLGIASEPPPDGPQHGSQHR